jgi:putative membrane protein
MPRTGWIAVAVLAVAGLAGCGSPAPPAPPRPMPMPAAAPPPSPQAAPTASSDQEFINTAMGMNASEIAMGELPRGKAVAKPVKALATRMVSDHTSANRQLAVLARQLKIAAAPGPVDPPPDLAAANGPDFDRKYVAIVVKSHQDAIALYQSEATGGQDARAKRFARTMLPTLQHHLHEAETLAKQLGL